MLIRKALRRKYPKSSLQKEFEKEFPIKKKGIIKKAYEEFKALKGKFKPKRKYKF